MREVQLQRGWERNGEARAVKNYEGKSDERKRGWGKEEPLMSSRVKRRYMLGQGVYRKTYSGQKQIQQ